MLVIGSAARKGGAGKTTTLWHLAIEAQRAGHGPVVMLDFDQEEREDDEPQQSLTKTWLGRQAEDVDLVAVTPQELPRYVEQKRREKGIIFIDTPPRANATIQAVLDVCDLVVIPCQPSKLDLEAVGATVGMVKTKGKPYVFVLNRADQRTRSTGEGRRALQVHGPVAGTFHNRIGYADAMAAGLAIQEFQPGSPGAEEVEGAWRFVTKMLSSASTDISKPAGKKVLKAAIE
jgi:chromosome partitioning protein